MAIETLPFYLAGAAESWFFSIDDTVKQSLTAIKEAIHQRFQPSSRNNLQLMDVKQKQTESVEDFIHRVTQMTTDRRVDQDWLITVIMNGLKPDIGADVIKVDPKSLEELRNVAARAEVAERRRTNSPALQENTNLALLNALQEIRDDMRANQRKFPQQQPRRPGKSKQQQGYRPPPPQAYQQSPPWPQQPPTQWQQPPPPGPHPGYNRPPQPYNNKE
ncbi:actin nucleation-promoting factor WAS-like [Saccostrea echinata]|uniref:actin nucleation-promoting factor WAS-like n=1 Tax=Saccostrea echinata TaxID=191078 RepID=UPI002A803EE7|nr:actin nucleation-promoting factor WAS-like [Saccostrea echinata]